ncbi:MAG: carbohydrate kinase family protein [Flexilinea sp.]
MNSSVDYSLLRQTAAKVNEDITKSTILSGFDGFIDSIFHVVDKRINRNEYTRIETINDYGERILSAAGLSTNIEQVLICNKMGGNGPIFLNALLGMGQNGIYIGALGNPINPLFQEMVAKATVISLCEPASTEALEFNDGKLIISQLSSFNNISFDLILDRIGKQRLIDYSNNCKMLSFMNWTMIPEMSEILESFIEQILPSIAEEKYVFFDLADPSKRSKSDLQHVLSLLSFFEPKCKVILSMNKKEAKQIADALGYHGNVELEQLAYEIAEKLGIFCVVIHPTADACTVINGKYHHVIGPYCKNPKFATGGGDNFNAGFCFGILQNWEPGICLITGVSTSGYYVRNGYSGNIAELHSFIIDWANNNL